MYKIQNGTPNNSMLSWAGIISRQSIIQYIYFSGRQVYFVFLHLVLQRALCVVQGRKPGEGDGGGVEARDARGDDGRRNWKDLGEKKPTEINNNAKVLHSTSTAEIIDMDLLSCFGADSTQLNKVQGFHILLGENISAWNTMYCSLALYDKNARKKPAAKSRFRVPCYIREWVTVNYRFIAIIPSLYRSIF